MDGVRVTPPSVPVIVCVVADHSSWDPVRHTGHWLH